MPSYSSWTWVIYKYITDPEIGPYSRIKRRVTNKPGYDTHFVSDSIYQKILIENKYSLDFAAFGTHELIFT